MRERVLPGRGELLLARDLQVGHRAGQLGGQGHLPRAERAPPTRGGRFRRAGLEKLNNMKSTSISEFGHSLEKMMK